MVAAMKQVVMKAVKSKPHSKNMVAAMKKVVMKTIKSKSASKNETNNAMKAVRSKPPTPNKAKTAMKAMSKPSGRKKTNKAMKAMKSKPSAPRKTNKAIKAMKAKPKTSKTIAKKSSAEPMLDPEEWLEYPLDASCVQYLRYHVQRKYLKEVPVLSFKHKKVTHFPSYLGNEISDWDIDVPTLSRERKMRIAAIKRDEKKTMS